jgi:hypothetical protein
MDRPENDTMPPHRPEYAAPTDWTAPSPGGQPPAIASEAGAASTITDQSLAGTGQNGFPGGARGGAGRGSTGQGSTGQGSTTT